MFLLLLLALFVAVAIMSLLGWTADSRDLRPRLPVQARGQQPDMSATERYGRTALPPYRGGR